MRSATATGYIDATCQGHPIWCLLPAAKVIFVHGCFWHRHVGCALARLPKSRGDFWVPKLEGNAERDKRNMRALRRLGWGVMTIWECQLRDTPQLESRVRRFLDA